jgi:membrane protease YdiL (CAAX protease family)
VSPLWKILLYVVVVLALAVVLSPPVYWLLQWIIGQGHLTFLEGFPFHRYFSRTLQVSGLVLLIPLIVWLRIRSVRELGIERNPRWLGDAGRGFVVAFLPMVILALVWLAMDIYGWRGQPDYGKLPRVVGTAVVVSLLEEFFFRGVLLGLAVRAMGRWLGALFSAVIFAGLHFLRPARMDTGGEVTWTSGWEQLMQITAGAPAWPLLGYGLLTLVLVGLLLAAVTLRTRSLWLAIGLHAGWILGQQGFLTVARFRVKPEDAMLPWVGPNLVSGAVPTGLIPVAVLVFSAAIVWLWVRRR